MLKIKLMLGAAALLAAVSVGATASYAECCHGFDLGK